MSRPLFLLCLFSLFVAVPALLFLPGLLAGEPGVPGLTREVAVEAAWTYVVRPGDVLGVIAQRELGTMRRVDEILALNPDVEPRALTVGSTLRMPPRAPARPAGIPALPGTASPAPEEAVAAGGGLLKLFLGLLIVVALFVLVAGRFDRRTTPG